MTEKTIFTDEYINNKIDEYLETHKDEIEEMINKKIGAAVRKSINNAFSYNGYNPRQSGPAYLQVNKLVTSELKLLINDFNIDTEDLKDKLTKQVNQQLNSLVKNTKIKF